MRRALTLLLLAAVPGLTGCVAGGASGSDLITARDAHDVAAPRALLWDADAELAVAVLAEVDNVTLDASGTTLVDDAIGDGRGVAWRLQYTSRNVTDHDLVVVVLENRTVYAALPVRTSATTGAYGVTAHYEERTHPVTNWTVDSDEATRVARRNATWRGVAERAESADVTLVGGPDQNPVWVVSVEAPAANGANATDAARVYVDAATGDLLDERPAWLDDRFRTWVDFGGAPPLPAESGRFSGTLTTTDPRVEHVLTVTQRGHRELSLRLVTDSPTLGTRVMVSVDPPHAGPRSVNITEPDAAWPGIEVASFDRPPAGTYEVAVHLADGAALRYRLCWVAGPPTDPDPVAVAGNGCGAAPGVPAVLDL